MARTGKVKADFTARKLGRDLKSRKRNVQGEMLCKVNDYDELVKYANAVIVEGP
jgi:hypothetical protein